MKSHTLPAKLSLRGWLELPYYIGVPYTGSFKSRVQTQDVPLSVQFRNDLLRIETWNQWTLPIVNRGMGEAWVPPGSGSFRFAPQYCSETELDKVVVELESAGAPYVHVEKPETVVEIAAEVDGWLPLGDTDAMLAGLLPYPWFWDELLPHISDIVDTYRIATLPKFRYRLHPVTEALVSSAVAELRDKDGQVVAKMRYKFDSRDNLRGFAHDLGNYAIASRFERLLNTAEDLEPENEMSVAYCLYHMRRWKESLLVASAVVDAMLRRVVFTKAPEKLAPVLWTAYRSRFQDLFNSVLPSLGVARLSEVQPQMWKDYMNAKSDRGAAAHGHTSRAYESESERATKAHLAAFVCTARWLSDQIERVWAMDVPTPDEIDEILPEFP